MYVSFPLCVYVCVSFGAEILPPTTLWDWLFSVRCSVHEFHIHCASNTFGMGLDALHGSVQRVVVRCLRVRDIIRQIYQQQSIHDMFIGYY